MIVQKEGSDGDFRETDLKDGHVVEGINGNLDSGSDIKSSSLRTREDRTEWRTNRIALRGKSNSRNKRRGGSLVKRGLV